MAKVIIQYEAETASLKASVSEINKVNDEVVKSAQDSSKKVADAYKQTGQAAAAAFASGGVKKALDEQNASIGGVTAKLKQLYDEEVKLLEQGKKATARYSENQKEAARLKTELDKLTKTTGEQNKAIDAQNNKAKSLTGQLRAYREQLSRLEQEGKETTQEFNNIAVAAARLEDQIGDTRERVRVLASDTFAFDAAIDATNQLAAGFAVAQGVTALFAEDSEELQEAIAKTGAALAILNGLQQINQFVTGQSAGKIAQQIGLQAAYNAAVATGITTVRAFNIALASIGVGAILAAITGVVLAIKSFIDENARFNDAIKRNNEVLATLPSILKTYADEYQALQDRIKVINNELSQEQADLNQKIAQSVDDAAKKLSPFVREQRNLEVELIQVNKNIAEQNARFDELNQKTIKSDATFEELRRTQEKINNETLKQSDLTKQLTRNREAQNKIIQESIKFQNALRKEVTDEAAAKRREEAEKKAAEAAKKALEEQLRARERLAQLENEIFVNSLAERERLLSDSNAKIQELEKAFIESRFKANSQEAIQAEQQLAIAIETIKSETNKKIAEIDKRDIEEKLKLDLEAAQLSAGATLQEQIKLLQTQRDLELAAADKLEKDKVEITKRYKKQIEDIEKELAQSTFRVKIDLLLAEEAQLGSTLERRIKLIETQAAAEIKAVQDSTLENEEKASRIRRIEAETQKAIRDEQKKTADDATKKRQEQIDQVIEYSKQLTSLFTQFSQLSAQLTENRIAGIQEASAAELESINNSVATERQKQREREALELRTSRRIAQEKVKQARLDKAIALFGAVVNTAEAITKALPNVVLAGIAGVLGAAQIATIAARPIPKFEKGGPVGGKRHSAGGTLIEAEKDEFVTRRQQSIRHRAELEAINNSSATFKRLIEQRYVRPAIERYMLNSARQNLTVRASLNSKSMEKKLDKMSKSMRQPVIVNINGKDNRYTWQ